MKSAERDPPDTAEQETPTGLADWSSQKGDNEPLSPTRTHDGPAQVAEFPQGVDRRLGKYELLSPIARGGMGIVFKAQQTDLNRIVAVKMILSRELASELEIRRFRAEAEAAATLDHPNIVAIHEVGEQDGRHFFSMSYVDGKNLGELLRDGPLSARQAARYMKIVAGAIDYAHRRGIVHRDLKPSNVLIDSHDQPRITDFGVAKRLEGDSELTATGQIVGTPSYMAPEQAGPGEHAVGPAVDVYSIGAILYELLTGRPPFRASTFPDTVLQVRELEPVSLRLLNPTVPRDLETICLKCLEKSPDRRYGSARELADDFDNYLNGRSIKARTVGPATRLIRGCRRNRLLSASLAAMSAAACSLIFGLSYHNARLNDVNEQLADSTSRLQAAVKFRDATITRIEQLRLREKRLLLEGYLQSGRRLCEQGEFENGMLWYARALESAGAGLEDIEFLSRSNLSGWFPALRKRWLPIRYQQEVRAVAFSPDGSMFITGSYDGTAQLWDARTGEAIGEPFQHDNQIRTAAFSPDGKIVVTGSLDRTVRFWDTATCRQIGEPLVHPAKVNGVDFSPDGQTVATSSWPDDTVRFWDSATRELIGEPIHLTGGVERVAFSPDGKTVLAGIAGDGDNTARLLDVATGRQIGRAFQHEGWIRAIAFSPDGKTVLTGSVDRTARLWDATTGEPLGPPLLHASGVWGVAFNADGRRFVTGSADGTAQLWDTADQVHIGGSLHLRDGISEMAFSPDETTVLVGCKNGWVCLWLTDVERFDAQPFEDDSEWWCSAFFADGTRLLTGCHDKEKSCESAKLWNTESGTIISHTIDQSLPIHAVAVHPNETVFVTVSGRGSVRSPPEQQSAGYMRVWNAASGAPLGPPLQAHTLRALAVAYDPQGTSFATGSEDGSVRLWNAATNSAIGKSMQHEGPVYYVEFRSDGKAILSAGADGILRIWDVKTNEPIGRPMKHRTRIHAAAFSPDGRKIISGCQDGRAWLWDAASQKMVGRPLSHPTSVDAVAFSPDGGMALTGCSSGFVRIWDGNTGIPLGRPLKHSSGIGRLHVSSDGNTVFAACEDKIVRRWRMPAPLQGDVERIALWLQIVTGMELDESDTLAELDSETWHRRRRRLEALGGPPVP